eukprot:TRINITY_DN3473_c0_g1_i2.p1 TRINITY_DN3473_c0_g1~~TRINITY_DN3473_c0_g1_i2.p1  ORF type:complete len:489 (+),score=39.52 TRINITY_DN3473_c0_g1_i2:62-1468(+)
MQCAGDCGLAVTGVTPTHCCKVCSMFRGKHGPACMKSPFQGTTDNNNSHLRAVCSRDHCNFAQTGIVEGYCCMACLNNRGHGQYCGQLSVTEANKDAGKTFALRNLERETSFGPFTLQWKKRNIAVLATDTPPRTLRVNEEGTVDSHGRGGLFAVFEIKQIVDTVVTLFAVTGKRFLSADDDGKLTAVHSEGCATLWTIDEVPLDTCLFPCFSVKVDPNLSLNPEEKRMFKEAGYIVKKQVIPKKLITEALKAINSRLCTPGAVVTDGLGGSGMKFCKDIATDSSIRNLLFGSGVWGLAQDLIGKNKIHPVRGGQIALRGPQSSLPDLAPGELHRSGWHIDGIDKGKHSAFTLLVGIALTDCVEPNNGNLIVYPGSHHVLLPLLKDSVAAGNLSLRHPRPVLSNPHHVCCTAGDVVFVHHKLAHAGGPNAGHQIRYQVYFRLSHKNHEEFTASNITLEDLWVEYEGLH